MEIVIIHALLLLNIISFLLGYLFGYLKNINNFTNHSNSFIKKNNTNNKTINATNIEIDDKKVVVNIDTKGLEKKYDELGDKIISETNISNSINKLKNLKK